MTVTAPRLTLAGTAGLTWRSLVIVAGLIVVVLALVRLRVVVLPVIVALLLTTFLGPAATWLVGRGLPRSLAALLLLLGGIGLIVGVVFLLAPSVSDQFADLGPTLDQARDDFDEWLQEGPLELSRQEIERYSDRAFDQLSGPESNVASGVLSGALLAGEIVAGILLTVVLVFFFVKDGERFCHFFLGLAPGRHRLLVQDVARRAWGALTGYVRGTAIVALVDATIIGVGLAIIGVPLVLPLALLTFVGAFFPLVGATLAGIVAVAVALVSGGVGDALWAAGVVIVVQQVEGDVLAPLVLGKAVALHPVVVVLVLAGGAVLGGLVGAFLAVPVAAVAVAVGSELRAQGVVGPDDEPAAAAVVTSEQ